MPLKTWNTKADFDAAYSIGAEPEGHPNTRAEVKLNYQRAVMLPLCRQRALGIAGAMGWTAPGPVMVIVGAGFSWLAEAFEEMGFTRVVGIDVSSYIQSVKSTTEEIDIDAAITATGLNPANGEGATIKSRLFDGGVRTRASRGVLNQTGSTQQSRNAVRSALGLSGNTQPDVLLTESVIESLTDAEFINDSTRLKAWVPLLVHYVVTLRDGNQPGYNWKTLEQWSALAPLDIFIEAGSYRRLP